MPLALSSAGKDQQGWVTNLLLLDEIRSPAENQFTTFMAEERSGSGKKAEANVGLRALNNSAESFGQDQIRDQGQSRPMD